MSPDDGKPQHDRPERGVTEMAVELTIAWLKRVESTADGRDPKEVVDALAAFFSAIHRHHQEEARAKGERQPVGAAH